MCMRLLQRFKEKLYNLFRLSRRDDGSRPPTPRLPPEPEEQKDIVANNSFVSTPQSLSFHGTNTDKNKEAYCPNERAPFDVDSRLPSGRPISDDFRLTEEDSHHNVVENDVVDEPLISQSKSPSAGKILVSFSYLFGANRLNMKITRANGQPPKGVCGTKRIRVHLCLLPQHKPRFRSKVVKISQSQAMINQTFHFEHMTKDLLENCAIRLRIYGITKFRKQLMGETIISLAKTDLTTPLADIDIWKTLKPKGILAKFFGISADDDDDDDEIDGEFDL